MRPLLACTCARGLRVAVDPVRPFVRAYHASPVASTSGSHLAPGDKGKGVERWAGWKTVIGLELHVQLKGNVKLLSPALATYDAAPNSHVATFDAALPGSLPVLGAEPVRLALLACLALKSKINLASRFDRKHYFYPDLPAGFQVTQKYHPLATGGIVRIRKQNDEAFDVRINQIQLEQDTAKSSHDPDTGNTLVDLNRAGAALIEIVTEPDMKSPEDAVAFVKHLQALLRHVGASDANMDRGELRCDVNVSVQRAVEGSLLGTRCEVKNLNGLRILTGAIESEVDRQIIELAAGRAVEQATRGYDAMSGQTFHLRSKGDAPDYRYMPDPELGSVIITEDRLAALLKTLPELPDVALDRIQTQYGLTARDAGILIALGGGVKYFEDVASSRDPQVAANWVINVLLGELVRVDLTFPQNPINTSDLGSLIDSVTSSSITGTTAKSILRDFLLSPSSSSLPSLIAAQASTTTTTSEISTICTSVLHDLPIEAAKVKAGQNKVLMRLVGEVMKRSKGRADAKSVAATLMKLINA